MRAFLENVAKRQIPVTYYEPAKALQISSPHSHPSVEALGRLREEDAEADRRFITALTISNAHGGLLARILRLSPKSRPALTIRCYYLGRYQI